MIYLDSRRQAAIKRFLAMVEQTQVEPYFSLLNALQWSYNNTFAKLEGSVGSRNGMYSA